jgi:hypothetical protein
MNRRQRRLMEREDIKMKKIIKEELERQIKKSGKNIEVTPDVIDLYNDNIKQVIDGLRMSKEKSGGI